MPASDSFTKLTEQVDGADERIKAAAAQSKADLERNVDAARKRADEHADEMRAKADRAAADADDRWHELQRDWKAHNQRVREHIDARKAKMDADVADSDAAWAETYAIDAINFASGAIEEAEYAVLDAVLARVDADSLTPTT